MPRWFLGLAAQATIWPLWRGWQELPLLLQGAQLAQELQAKCG